MESINGYLTLMDINVKLISINININIHEWIFDKFDIRTQSKEKVILSEHFGLPGHSITDVKITILEK